MDIYFFRDQTFFDHFISWSDKTYDLYSKKYKMEIEKGEKKHYNGTKESTKKRWSKWHEEEREIGWTREQSSYWSL